MEYEIDNSKQDHLIEVMNAVQIKQEEIFPDINAKFFFEWEDNLIKKVYYFWDVEDEKAWNAYFDRNQNSKDWLKFVMAEYHPPKFVTPDSVKLRLIHEVGSEPKEMELGGWDYTYKISDDLSKIERVPINKEDN